MYLLARSTNLSDSFLNLTFTYLKIYLQYVDLEIFPSKFSILLNNERKHEFKLKYPINYIRLKLKNVIF